MNRDYPGAGWYEPTNDDWWDDGKDALTEDEEEEDYPVEMDDFHQLVDNLRLDGEIDW